MRGGARGRARLPRVYTLPPHGGRRRRAKEQALARTVGRRTQFIDDALRFGLRIGHLQQRLSRDGFGNKYCPNEPMRPPCLRA